ncbi:MAG TPA: CHRD domain-containing protein [Intrasporangium sp.]|uniref:CHRD domain-containing protein n=1 Tax=Intrasporangium sp. TaxID=1925024 RepID=UPI002D77FC1F|nr:CHRD domain-containing protein [Intrasporangium sp.]HET7397856.1 CHRD domain-containing protein [Intrasporangium sp.]
MHRTTRRLLSVVVAVAATTLSVPATATAAGRHLEADLKGSAATVPHAEGEAEVRIDQGQRRLCYTLEVEGLRGVVAAHIHAGRANQNGPVVVPLKAPTMGMSSGCVEISRELGRAILMNPSAYYVNVHTMQFPAGAIRGQLHRDDDHGDHHGDHDGDHHGDHHGDD